MITVEPEALTSAGVGLSASPATGSTPACEPAAGDPVSASVAAVFNSHAIAAAALLTHAAGQRMAGGGSLSSTAQTLQTADEDGAAAITSGNPAAVGAAMPAAVAVIPAPPLPGIPVVAPPAPLPGEQIAALVHSGPGPGSLRVMASELRDVAGRVSGLAADTRRYGRLVDEHWQDGQQQAGANVGEHADWLDAMSTHLSSLAEGADESAGHAESLIAQTPRPEEFTELRGRLRQAVADFNRSGGLNPAPVAAVMSQLSQKQTTAVTAHQGYYAAAASTTGGLAPTPAPAPPITRAGGGSKPQPDPGSTHRKESGQPGGGGGHGGKSGGIDPADNPGTGITDPASTAGVPVGQPPLPAASPVAGAEGVVAEIAGALVGAGTSSLGQAAGGLHSLAAAPMSALSGLSGLGGGMPQAPQMPSGGDGGGQPDFDPGGGNDFGSGATTPAGGGGGDMGGGAPVSAPAVGPVSAGWPSAGLAGASSPLSPGGSGGGMGGGGFMPPMMGMGGKPGSEQDKHRDRRVVFRPTPNSEPVFGELERQRPSARRRIEQQQATTSEETP